MPGQGQVSQSQRSARFVLCGRCPHTLAGMTGHQATKDLDDVGTQGDRTRQDEGRRLHTRVQKGASIPTSRGPLWSHRRIRRCVGRTCIMAHSCSIRMGRLRARRLHDVHRLLVGLGQDFQERGSDGRVATYLPDHLRVPARSQREGCQDEDIASRSMDRTTSPLPHRRRTGVVGWPRQLLGCWVAWSLDVVRLPLSWRKPRFRPFGGGLLLRGSSSLR